MNLLDLVLLLLLAAAAYSGFRRGALMQMAIYLGLLLGLLVGSLLAPRAASLTPDSTSQAAVALGVFLLAAALGDAAGWVVGRRLWMATRESGFGRVDSAGGSVVAVVALLLATWFIALNLSTGPSAALSREIRRSVIVRGLDAVMPEPPSVLQEIRNFLSHLGLPIVFAGIPPPPAGAVDAPTEEQALSAFLQAEDATLRVVGSACGRLQEGSGFVAAQGHVVTNAHVVAGVRSPRVQQQNGGSQRAQTVLFDPDLDIAVLRVGNTPAEPLPLTVGEVDRGAKGAVVGYPQGGDLSGEAAANRRILHAVGRDIYGDDRVERDIYELQAEVRPGNSGGPFVLVNGEVAGVVFASSTDDAQVGYAVTSDEVRPLVEAATSADGPVSTGPCTE